MAMPTVAAAVFAAAATLARLSSSLPLVRVRHASEVRMMGVRPADLTCLAKFWRVVLELRDADARGGFLVIVAELDGPGSRH